MDDREAQALFERARSGDVDAFSGLIAPVRSRLLAVIHLRLPTGARARFDPEDILQETLVQAIELLKDFDWQGVAAFRTWLTRIATNRVQRTYRRLGLESGTEDLERSDDGGQADDAPLRRMRQEERFERLKAALDRLPPAYREVVMLARIEGLGINEIAAQTGKTPGATSMTLLRALRALRNEFGETESLTLPQRSLGGRP